MTPWDHLKSVVSLGVISLNLAFFLALALPTLAGALTAMSAPHDDESGRGSGRERAGSVV